MAVQDNTSVTLLLKCKNKHLINGPPSNGGKKNPTNHITLNINDILKAQILLQ